MYSLITAIPIDDIPHRPAIEPGAQILAKENDPAVPILVAGARNVWREQHSGIGPEPSHRGMLELANIDIEHGAAQVIAGQRVSQSVLIDDLAPSDVDEDAVRLHSGETVLVEQAVRFRRPLATDGDDIAVR